MLAAAVRIASIFFWPAWIAHGGQAAQINPRQVVEQAWQRARELGRYRFTTDLEASNYPGRPASA